MPSHDTKGIELLLEKGPIHTVLWYNLIEARRALIKPLLDTFTLREVGNLKILQGGLDSPPHSLADDGPIVHASEGLPFLKTQGIFLDGLSMAESVPGYDKCVVGLSRSGEWLVVGVKIVSDAIGGYQAAREVGIYKQDLEQILFGLEISCDEMWYQLGEAIKGWLGLRQRLYEEVLKISHTIEIEDLLLLNRPVA